MGQGSSVWVGHKGRNIDFTPRGSATSGYFARPQSTVGASRRCPEGCRARCFYQKSFWIFRSFFRLAWMRFVIALMISAWERSFPDFQEKGASGHFPSSMVPPNRVFWAAFRVGFLFEVSAAVRDSAI